MRGNGSCGVELVCRGRGGAGEGGIGRQGSLVAGAWG
jgi:hypothetical protein